MEVSAGRDSTRRRAAAAAADDAGGGGGMEAQVVPLELYDSARAKIDANLRWLFAKAYGTGKTFSVFTSHCWDLVFFLTSVCFYLSYLYIQANIHCV